MRLRLFVDANGLCPIELRKSERSLKAETKTRSDARGVRTLIIRWCLRTYQRSRRILVLHELDRLLDSKPALSSAFESVLRIVIAVVPERNRNGLSDVLPKFEGMVPSTR